MSPEPSGRESPVRPWQELYFWSLVVAILIFALGGGMSVYRMLPTWLIRMRSDRPGLCGG